MCSQRSRAWPCAWSTSPRPSHALAPRTKPRQCSGCSCGGPDGCEIHWPLSDFVPKSSSLSPLLSVLAPPQLAAAPTVPAPAMGFLHRATKHIKRRTKCTTPQRRQRTRLDSHTGPQNGAPSLTFSMSLPHLSLVSPYFPFPILAFFHFLPVALQSRWRALFRNPESPSDT